MARWSASARACCQVWVAGQLLAVPVQDISQHAERVPGSGGFGSWVRSGWLSGGVLVVAGQFGGRARARRRVGELRGHGEHVGGVGVGAAGQGDVGVLAVLGAGDHRQAGVHGAALRGVVGDRVAQFGSFVAGVQEVPVGPAALPGFRVRIQRPADDQAAGGDGFDAQQVAVGQGPAGFSRLDAMVVAGAHDQVPGAGRGAVGDARGGAGLDDAEVNQVIADAAGQFPAQRVIGGHQQRVGAVHGERDVGGRGGIHHTFRIAALDPAVLVILGQDGGVAGAQPQAGGLFPAGAEPGRLGQLDVAELIGEQGHAAAVFHRLQLPGVPGQDHLAVGCFGEADQVGQVRGTDHRRLVHRQQGTRDDGDDRRAHTRNGVQRGLGYRPLLVMAGK